MLTETRLEQLLRNGHEDRLIDELLANGREVPLSTRLLLSDPPGRRAAALGLSLQRLAELSHGASRTCEDVCMALLAMQRREGGFGTIAATIAALAGALTFAQVQKTEEVAPELSKAVDAGLGYLSQQQDESGLLGGDAQLSILALRMLMPFQEFLGRVRFGDLAEALLASPECAAGFEQLLSSARHVSSAA